MISLNVCISGFTQTQGRGHGVFRLSEELVRRGYNEGVHRRVWYLRWNENWRRWAEHVDLISVLHNQEVLVAIHGYSWGGGWGAMEFARELRRLGIGVRFAVLCDAVYRDWLAPLRYRALFGRDTHFLPAPLIRVPSNVGEVFPFHQTMDRPQGHRLLPENGTKIHPSARLYRTHGAMDDAPEFHSQSLAVAEMLADLADRGGVSGRYQAA